MFALLSKLVAYLLGKDFQIVTATQMARQNAAKVADARSQMLVALNRALKDVGSELSSDKLAEHYRSKVQESRQQQEAITGQINDLNAQLITEQAAEKEANWLAETLS